MIKITSVKRATDRTLTTDQGAVPSIFLRYNSILFFLRVVKIFAITSSQKETPNNPIHWKQLPSCFNKES